MLRAFATLLLTLAVISVASVPASAAPCATGEARSLALLSARTGKLAHAYPGVSGVTVVLADGRGGWFVGGSIACLAGLRGTVSVAHLDPAGQLDRGWHPVRGAPVGVLAIAGTTLYAGGTSGVEAIDATTGRVRWATRVQGGGEPGVDALAASPDAVYVGGSFKALAGRRTPALVALDPATGRLLGWRPPALGCVAATCAVDGLALDGSRLFVGGNTIATVGGQRRPEFAELDAGTGALAAWVPANGHGVGDVETILIAGGAVFSAGLDGFGITDELTGAISPLLRTVRSAYRFAAFGDVVYLGGTLRTSLRLQGARRHNLGAVDLVTGRASAWAPDLDTYVGISSIAASATHVLVAGSFSRSLG
jgi:outer membrane protein assembly factor BamB